MIRPKHWILALALMTGIPAAKAQLTYYDADDFPLLGKAAERTETRYERLPAEYRGVSRGPVWELGKCSAGLAVRFRSNSTTIAARWTALFDRTMNHQTQTGTRGLDLYCLQEDGAWTFVNSARPTGQKNETVIITDMEPAEREYMLYLPLYDGILDLEIGIDSLARIGQPAVDLPQRERPVVFYGTSILQGGCANRPGMAHTSIISRRLNRECINLGFSENALLDLEIARLMAEVDAAVFVLDFVPNASVEEMNDRMETFYRILRDRHPDTPVIFIEDPRYPHGRFDKRMAEEVRRKNETVNRIFGELKEKGEKHIYMISSERMLGDDAEATVDGVHFTDLGMMRYADLVCPVIKRHLKR